MIKSQPTRKEKILAHRSLKRVWSQLRICSAQYLRIRTSGFSTLKDWPAGVAVDSQALEEKALKVREIDGLALAYSTDFICGHGEVSLGLLVLHL